MLGLVENSLRGIFERLGFTQLLFSWAFFKEASMSAEEKLTELRAELKDFTPPQLAINRVLLTDIMNTIQKANDLGVGGLQVAQILVYLSKVCAVQADDILESAVPGGEEV